MLVSEAAADLGLSRWSVWQFMQRGRLRYKTHGKFRFVLAEDVAALKAERTQTHPHGAKRPGRPRRGH